MLFRFLTWLPSLLPAQFITGPALDHQTFYHTEKINLTQQLSFSSFNQSGVYSEEFLFKKSVQEKCMGKEVMGDCEMIAEGRLNIVGNIDYESLTSLTVCLAQL